MVKLTGPTNYQLKELLVQLDAQPHQNHFWKRIAEDLRRPTRERRTINVYKIEKFAQDGETIVVPGKVLSVGSHFFRRSKTKNRKCQRENLNLTRIIKKQS